MLNTYGVNGNPAQSNVFCGINKTDDGSRTAEKGDAHRDVIMARTGETYLIKAECQVRLGNYNEAIATVNKLRARAEWKQGEDREYYSDGSQAFSTNSTGAAILGKCYPNANNNKNERLTNSQAYSASYLTKSTYYLSTGIDRTTDASSLQIASYSQLPAEDEAILNELGVSLKRKSDKQEDILVNSNDAANESKIIESLSVAICKIRSINLKGFGVSKILSRSGKILMISFFASSVCPTSEYCHKLVGSLPPTADKYVFRLMPPRPFFVK